MNLVAVVLLAGSHCVSPMAHAPGLTEVAKVPCAVLIRLDANTSDVSIEPPAAATDPAVIALLVRPGPAVAAAKSDRLPISNPADITGSTAPAPRIVPASAEPDAPPRAKPLLKKTRQKPSAVAGRAATSCGSWRAVWYVNKDGHRKYRCVRRG